MRPATRTGFARCSWGTVGVSIRNKTPNPDQRLWFQSFEQSVMAAEFSSNDLRSLVLCNCSSGTENSRRRKLTNIRLMSRSGRQAWCFQKATGLSSLSRAAISKFPACSVGCCIIIQRTAILSNSAASVPSLLEPPTSRICYCLSFPRANLLSKPE